MYEPGCRRRLLIAHGAGNAFLGGLAQIFGRKPIILGSLGVFAAGSAVAAAAQSMNMLIAGRSESNRSRQMLPPLNVVSPS